MRVCDLCNAVIPEDYNNLLCDSCYKKIEEDNKRLALLADEEKIETVIVSSEEIQREETPAAEGAHDPVITDPAYKENPEQEDKPQWEANFQLFAKHGYMIWHPTRDMYEFINRYNLDKVLQHPQYPKFIWKPKIVDVGCGTGVGSNILSQEADFVWGIDKNEKSLQFAKQCFSRVKNGIYYSSQVEFDCIDFVKDSRTFMKFDVVVSIEVFEHINDWRTFVKNLIEKFDNRSPHTPTEYFISTPNRNNRHIRNDKPYNPYHVRELSSAEFFNALSEYFSEVYFYNSKGEPIEGIETNHTPLLARASKPKI